jgi:hypothetical protein
VDLVSDKIIGSLQRKNGNNKSDTGWKECPFVMMLCSEHEM